MNFAYPNYQTQFSTIHDIIAHMQSLNQSLRNTDLQNLIAFNNTYLIITQAVAQKFGQAYFDNDQRMEKFDILFAQFYFDALCNFTHHKPCAPAWQLLFEHCQKSNLMQWQYMALGVNAHVNNDLPLTLDKFGCDDSYQNDFYKINQILQAEIPKVVKSFQEKNYIINQVKNSTIPAYKPFLTFLIKQWRHNAWQNYLLLHRNLSIHSKIQTLSTKLAKHIIKVTL